MRKLRKKIYKQCVVSKKSKKVKDSSDQILGILNQSHIPEFVTESLKKRRNFDIGSIKNILITAPLPLEDIRNRVNLQEQQVNSLFLEHR